MRGPQPWRTNRSRVLRSRPISAEAKLWTKLRDRRLNGHKFVRQAAVGPYFVDFLCKECRIIVEIDGGTHGTDQEIASDKERAADLRRLGYRVFRVWNGDAYSNIDRVLDGLLAFIESEHS